MRSTLVQQAVSNEWPSRTVGPGDTRDLGALMLAAYRGTVDDEGETEDDAVGEVERTIDGEYGTFLFGCSLVIEHGSRAIGASMVTFFESRPFLAYLVVRPEMKRRGIGAWLVGTSGNALLSGGHSTLDLFVTEANEPAVNLYRKLGFEVVDRVTAPA